MAGYFGTAVQQRLQARAEDAAAFIAATPGACQVGRMMGCDDPDRLGWDHIGEVLRHDLAFGFRLIDRDRVDDLRSRLAERGCRLDTWQVFLADRASALAASQTILSRGLPAGLAELERARDPDGDGIRRIQAHMAAAGIAPFSGSMLTGACGPAVTVGFKDAEGGILATAHGYLPHSVHSPYQRYAWGGLVAVAAEARAQGLGSLVNARLIAEVFRELEATHIYELVSDTNVASRRMVEACGLRAEPGLVCGVGVAEDSTRFTR
ncbi:GNAT family N-acetyltransferase [Mangrovicella endophytica]|uniref:GNAT family N-acetyltransferase n=1 Tax=Mangrovicella endophytica TaxID=2066697 RepID=UPI000C9DCCE6|nr:GNAT family N-acetyltransferase [Mangrovicella endophytica]